MITNELVSSHGQAERVKEFGIERFLKEEMYLRGSGRTTGIILSRLGMAIMNPRKDVQVVDHIDNPIQSQARELACRIRDVTNSLGLKHIYVRVTQHNEVFIKFKNEGAK